jgi:hypothetical protein
MSSRSAATSTLDKLDQVNLAQLDPQKAISFFGKPDIHEIVGQETSQEALVYLNTQDPRSPLLSLIFDSKTKKLVSANWFSTNKDTGLNFSKIQKRYPNEVFEKPSAIKDGAYGAKLSRYKSSTGPLRVFLRDESDEVSALSWVLVEDTNQSKRRPTSH